MRWDTKKVHQYKKRLRSVRTWQLLVLLLLSALVSATLLRLNNLNMSELRHAAITADEKGDEAAIRKAVNDLGSYVTSHMNTDMGEGFYLSASYERARQAIVKSAGDTANPDSALYQKASVECQSAAARAPFGGYYVPCVLSRVKDIGGSDRLVTELKLPRSELYKIDFVSPLWSPDAAGIGVAISVIILLAILFQAIGAIVLRLLLKYQFRSI